MKVKNLNNSSKKTKTLIKNTFAELLNEYKELNKVTVTELVKKADINRTTFYNHYDSIYDVAKDFEAELIKVLIDDTGSLKSNKDFFNYFDNIINYFKKNEYIYKLFLSSKLPFIFLQELNFSICNKLYLSLKNNPDFSKVQSLKFYIAFFTDGVTGQLLKYFTNNSNYSLDEINIYIKALFKNIFITT